MTAAGNSLLFLALAVCAAEAQDSRFPPKNQLIPAPPCLTIKGAWEGGYTPCTQAAHEAWLKDIRHWREERRIRTGNERSRYANPALQWTQSSFMQPQMMVHDRYFFDPLSGQYTVGRYLADLEKRYGGIDSVLIWPTYPNMGIDNRNQHDMIRSMPGGIPGAKQMIVDFHRQGVRVLFPMMMWDEGTRDPGKPWPEAIAELMKELDADGINGDTQDGVPAAFTLAAEKLRHPLAFEPEGSPSDEALSWNVMTWGQYAGQFDFVPGVDRFRWLEPRHMVHISDRWNRNRTNDLQFAFFNGEGWESWENIWGIWNGLTARDAEATRRIATVERALAPFLVSPEWEPFYPTHRYGIFASAWPLVRETAWTIVNRSEYDVEGTQMSVPHANGTRYFDLYHGLELTPERKGEVDVLSFSIEAHGYGAVLATASEPSGAMQQLMAKMKSLTAQLLSNSSTEWVTLPQKLVPIPATEPAASAPEGTVRVSGGDYLFKVEGLEIEGANDGGVDVQYPWENSARRFHEHRMQIAPFYMDKFTVTNARFKGFLDASHYHPKDDLNFLQDWKDGNFPQGWANKPVTWVSQDDARAYAAWAGKRLPHEWEWQLAAQGTDGRLYPWGNEWRASAVPVPEKGRNLREADNVDAHPDGASPFGLQDMVGNVWQWTGIHR